MKKNISVCSCCFAIATILIAAIGLSLGQTAVAQDNSAKGKFYTLFVWSGSPANGASFEKMVAGSAKEFESKLDKLNLTEKANPNCGGSIIIKGQETTPQKIIDAIGELSAKAGENDALFVYILSHGFSVNPVEVYKEKDANPRDREHFIAPSAGFDKDGETIGPNFKLKINKEAIWRSNILWAMRQHKHRLDFLVTDSCSSDYQNELRRTRLLQLAPAPNGCASGLVAMKPILALEYILTRAEGTASWNSSNPLSSMDSNGKLNDTIQELSYGGRYGTNFTLAFIQAASRAVGPDSGYNLEDFFVDLGKDYDEIYKEFYELVRGPDAQGEEGVITFGEEAANHIWENQILTTLTAFNTENEESETNPVKKLDILLKTNNQVKKTYGHDGIGSGKADAPTVKESVLKKLTDYVIPGSDGKTQGTVDPDLVPDDQI